VPKNKKGLGIGDIYPVVLTIALVGILLAIVLFTLEEIGESVPTETATTTNETEAWINGTGYTLVNASDCGFESPAITGAWNSSNGLLIAAGNYTVSDAGVLTNLTATAWDDDVNFSYTFEWGGTACDATEDIADDFVDFIPWIGVILLVVAAAIVIGVLMRSFAGGAGGRV